MNVDVADAVRVRPPHRNRLPDAARAEPARLAREIEVIGRSPLVSAMLQSLDATLVVLNAQRQIVATSGPAARGAERVGQRLGEALGCVNARLGSGCGAAPGCRDCGALAAVLGCQAAGRTTEAECQLTSDDRGTARELAVRAVPVEAEGAGFTVVTLRDVTVERRCEQLEQVFFHDVLNTVTGLRGWAAWLGREGVDRAPAARRVELLATRLVAEIRGHRALVLAERGELQPAFQRVRPAELFEELQVLWFGHAAAGERSLEVTPPPEALELETDRALLLRVLVNMVQNALEALAPGGVVRVACQEEPPSGGAPASLRLTVWNAGEIPADVQRRIFQRSFSTKAARGRGLGTYGMKLLGERYLGGEVSFTSSEAGGTRFELRLPLAPPDAAHPAPAT